MTNDHELVCDVTVIVNEVISDHNTINFDIYLEALANESNSQNLQQTEELEGFNKFEFKSLKDKDWSKICNSINKIYWKN